MCMGRGAREAFVSVLTHSLKLTKQFFYSTLDNFIGLSPNKKGIRRRCICDEKENKTMQRCCLKSDQALIAEKGQVAVLYLLFIDIASHLFLAFKNYKQRFVEIDFDSWPALELMFYVLIEQDLFS